MTPYLQALGELRSPEVLAFLVLGSVAGIVLGSIPGLGPTVAISLLLPFVFHMSPVSALVFLTGLYQAAEYGGSITAIAAATPGASNQAAAMLDGYELNRRGFPGKAFAYSLWSVVASSYATTLLLLALAVPVSAVALRFGPVELSALDILAFTVVGILTRGSPVKGMLSAALGLLLSTVGTDLVTGAVRYTFGITDLLGGIPLIPLLIGLFAIPEALRLLCGGASLGAPAARGAQRVWLSMREWISVLPAVGLGTAVGFVLGLIPGMAGAVPPWVSYGLAKASSKRPERFGNGHPPGIAAPESTNGAVMHATLIPAFFLGIPGTPASAVILGAMTIVGLQPGPLVFVQHAPVVLSVIEALIVSTTLLWVFGTMMTTLWAHAVSRLRPQALGIGVLVLGCVGAYTANAQTFGILVAVLFGLVAFGMRAAAIPPAPMIIGFILGGQFETNFRTALLASQGRFSVFLTDPLSAVLLLASLLVVLWILAGSLRSGSRPAEGSASSGAR
jgi:putative tricarboxylic transport membrane protein